MKKAHYESTKDKASRLRHQRRVIVVNREKTLVIGDHDTYLVQKKGSSWSCDCKWGRYRGAHMDCSHIIAAKQARKDLEGQAVVARLADLLMEAKVG